MKKLKVNDKNYALFEYIPFIDNQWNEIKRPKNTKYDLGDVVYLKHTNAIGVIIGSIGTYDARTDMDGMVSFEDMRPATLKDFEIEDVNFDETLLQDLLTENREENTKVIGGITHFKDNSFDYHTAKKHKKLHPLGDVYEADYKTGYVASGYDWFKFPLKRLEFINENYK